MILKHAHDYLLPGAQQKDVAQACDLLIQLRAMFAHRAWARTLARKNKHYYRM